MGTGSYRGQTSDLRGQAPVVRERIEKELL
jgi:hypothetical protein